MLDVPPLRPIRLGILAAAYIQVSGELAAENYPRRDCEIPREGL